MNLKPYSELTGEDLKQLMDALVNKTLSVEEIDYYYKTMLEAEEVGT